ncbi:MAG TPA: hypothetical protein VGM88_31040 [Kofleriaceae bacterium]
MTRVATLLLLGGCLNVPSFDGGGGGGDDAGTHRDGGTQPAGDVKVRVVSRDGMATPVPAARIVARDADGNDGDVVMTDGSGEANVPIAGPSTLFVATPADVGTPQLVAIEDVGASEVLDIGEIALPQSPGPTTISAALSSTAAPSDTLYLFTPCGTGTDSASKAIVFASLDPRCDGRSGLPALVWEEPPSDRLHVQQWYAGTFDGGDSSIAMSPPTVGTPVDLHVTLGALPSTTISGAIRGLVGGHPTGIAPFATTAAAADLELRFGDPDNAVEVESYTSYSDGVGVVAIRERESLDMMLGIDLRELSLPPIPMVTAVASGTVTWMEEASNGAAQEPTLVVVDIPLASGAVRWIAPGTARGLPGSRKMHLDTPAAFPELAVGSGAAPSVQLVLLREASYGDVRDIADLAAGAEPDFLTSVNSRMAVTGLAHVPQVVP